MALRLTSRGLVRQKQIAIVSVAVGAYAPIADGLLASLRRFRTEADVFCFKDLAEIRAPPHAEHPYAFKLYAIEYVRSRGYSIVIWCDSCLRAVRSPAEFAREIEKVGVYLQEDELWVGNWCNDRTLNYFGVTRDEAVKIPAIYACMMGFDFRTPIATRFFEEWERAYIKGMFKGRWDNKEHTESQDDRCRGHRHDQSCAGLIAWKLGIPHSPVRVIPNQPENPTRFFTTWNHP